jgi:hypothetical protein
VLVVTDEALQEATDLPAAQFHFETALEMMNKLKEQLREQEGPDAPVSVCAGAVRACAVFVLGTSERLSCVCAREGESRAYAVECSLSAYTGCIVGKRFIIQD